MIDQPSVIASRFQRSLLDRLLYGEVITCAIAPLLYFLILLIMIDGLIPQTEMLLFSGRLIVPMLLVKTFLILLVILAFAIKPERKGNLVPMRPWIAFVAFLVLDIPHLLGEHISLFDVLRGYYGYYSLVLILPMLGVATSKLEPRLIVRSLYIIFWVCAIIGIAQHLLNSPLLPTSSSDGSFEVISWSLYGTGLVRSFSLFVYSVNFGLYCTLVGSIGLHSYLHDRSNKYGLLVYSVSCLCVYCTLTRVVYLVFAIATMTIFVVVFSKSQRLLMYSPVLGFGLGGFSAYGGLIFFNNRAGLTDNLSLIQRITQFAYYWSIFINGNLSQRLFGIGFVQDSKVNGQETYPIDNLFMALLLHIGIVGLFILLVLFWRIYIRIATITRDAPTSLHSAVCAVWSSFLAISLFDISVAFFACSAMLFILTSRYDAKAERSNLGFLT